MPDETPSTDPKSPAAPGAPTTRTAPAAGGTVHATPPPGRTQTVETAWAGHPGYTAPYATPPGFIGPRRPTLVERYWPKPATPPSVALLAACLAVGLVVASTFYAPRLGLQSGLVAAALTVVAVLATRGDDRPRSAYRTTAAGLAVALAWVPAVRDAAPTVALSVVGALGLALLAAADGRTWPSVFLTGPATAVASVRGALWAGSRFASVKRPAGLGPWLRGGALGLLVVWVVGALLASADSAFAAVVDAVVPSLDLESLPGRAVLLVIGAVFALALATLAASPPRWEAVRVPYRAGSTVEWAVPLVLVDAVLAVFVAVQAAVMFAARPDALLGTGTTAAERARQGFGQLVAVTLIAVVLLAWAGRRAGTDRSSGRRLLALLGGGLVVLVLVVVASALRRMALYEQYFGWTVLRLHVAAFEVWLAVVLVLCGLAWTVRRVDLVARGVVLAAAGALLGLNLLSPDAVAASANVDRYAATGKVDLAYLARLSDDAVPALTRLPAADKVTVLEGRVAKHDPWYAVNLSRLRAAGILPDTAPPSELGRLEIPDQS